MHVGSAEPWNSYEIRCIADACVCHVMQDQIHAAVSSVRASLRAALQCERRPCLGLVLFFWATYGSLPAAMHCLNGFLFGNLPLTALLSLPAALHCSDGFLFDGLSYAVSSYPILSCLKLSLSAAFHCLGWLPVWQLLSYAV